MLLEGCKHELEITVPVDEITSETDRVVAKIQQKVRLPGFRPGKAPAQIVERVLGWDAIKQEAVDALLPTMYSQALDRENMPEQQAVPYLAILVSQIYEDAEKTFGKDKAKRGYKAAQQQVFGTDASALSVPDVAGRLPRV